MGFNVDFCCDSQFSRVCLTLLSIVQKTASPVSEAASSTRGGSDRLAASFILWEYPVFLLPDQIRILHSRYRRAGSVSLPA